MSTRQVIHTDAAPKTSYPYVQAVRYGQLVFLSGQVGVDPATGVPAPGGITGQTRQALNNVRSILAAAGASLSDVLEVTCFLRSAGDFEDFNAVYSEYFLDSLPARTTVEAAPPLADLIVEIRVVASIPSE